MGVNLFQYKTFRKYKPVSQYFTSPKQTFLKTNILFFMILCSNEKNCCNFALVKPKDVRQPLG